MTLKNTDKINAVFTIRNNQTFNDREECLEVMTEGSFYLKNGTFFLLYKEYGELGSVSVLIRAKGGVVSIKRSGACSSRMEYKENTHQEVLYSLPYGDMIIDLDTEIVDNLLNVSGGSVRLKYKLTINHEEYFNDMTIGVSLR